MYFRAQKIGLNQSKPVFVGLYNFPKLEDQRLDCGYSLQKISDLEISAVWQFDEGQQCLTVLNQHSLYCLLSTFGVEFMCKKHLLI